MSDALLAHFPLLTPSGVEYRGQLEPLTRYFWRVEAHFNDGSTLTSDISTFVTGKLDSPWAGKWVGNNTSDPFYLRRQWSATKPVKQAFTVVSGLGHFVFHLNGRKVSDHEMDPGWTNYRKVVPYVLFDVTDEIRQGPNAFGVEVANGWYHGKAGGRFFQLEATGIVPKLSPNVEELEYQTFGDVLPAIVEVHVQYEDGTTEVVATDDTTWRVCESATTLANIFGSEDFDARKEPVGWTLPTFDDTTWETAQAIPVDRAPLGALTAQIQPVAVKKVYEPISITQLGVGKLIVDMGQNMAGMLEISVRGASGEVVKFSMAEKLRADNGDIEVRVDGDHLIQWGDCNVRHEYTLRGDDKGEQWKQQFSYYGGRYVRVDNARLPDDESSAFPELLAIRAHYITIKAPVIGKFSSSDQRLNDVYRLVTEAVDSNLQSTHTDCPCYEKAAWLEASQIMAPSIMFHRDVSFLYAKIFADIRADQWHAGDRDFYNGKLAQYQKEGFIGSRAPVYEIKWTSIPPGDIWDIPPWGSCIAIGPHWHHLYYGNDKVVADNYEAAKAYTKYLGSRATAEGLIEHGLGDWGNQNVHEMAKANVETATYYLDLAIIRDFAKIVGNDADAAEYGKQAETVRDNYVTRLMEFDTTTKRWGFRAKADPRLSFRLINAIFSFKAWLRGPGMTPISQAMPLMLDMVPAERAEDVLATLRHTLDTDGYSCGELSLPYVINVLRKHGYNQDILDNLVVAKEHPSYYRFCEHGETSLPEYFIDNARSRNHDMMGSILQWFYNGLAGLEPTKPGFKQFTVRPWLGKMLTNINVEYMSASGRISVVATRSGTSAIVDLVVPPNTRCSAQLDRVLPAGRVATWNSVEVAEGRSEFDLGSGRHQFIISV